MCFENELRTATPAARHSYLCTGVCGKCKVERAPEKEYLSAIYRISLTDARKNIGRKKRAYFSKNGKQKFYPSYPGDKMGKCQGKV
jgi:hypothetical protein